MSPDRWKTSECVFSSRLCLHILWSIKAENQVFPQAFFPHCVIICVYCVSCIVSPRLGEFLWTQLPPPVLWITVSVQAHWACPLSWLPGDVLILLVVVLMMSCTPDRRSGHSYQHSSNPLTCHDPTGPLPSWWPCICHMPVTAVTSAKYRCLNKPPKLCSLCLSWSNFCDSSDLYLHLSLYVLSNSLRISGEVIILSPPFSGSINIKMHFCCRVSTNSCVLCFCFYYYISS